MAWPAWIISNVALASLLALAALFVQHWLRRPAVARILWLLVLVKLMTPPLVSVPLIELPGEVACWLGVCGCAIHAGTLARVGPTLLWVLLAVWLAGAIVMSWATWTRLSRFRRLLAHTSPARPEWQAMVVRLCSELSIRRFPEILIVPGRLPPLVVPGWRRSRMLLPKAFLEQLNDSQRVALLLHELVHIKRGDHLVRMLELAVGVVYWWLPVAGPFGRQLRACEEACCDAAVVNYRPQGRRDYARLLLDVVDFANPLPQQAAPQATAMSAANGLEQRLRGILDAKRPTRHAWPVAALTLALACATLPCQLNYGFVGQEVSAATKDGCEPAARTANWSGRFGCEPIESMRCPSL